MSDRLKQLQQQRARLLEQLAQLEHEISVELSPDNSARNPVAPAPIVDTSPAATEVAASDILARYQSDPASLKENVKKGCFLYFFTAFVVVGIGVLALYLYSTRR